MVTEILNAIKALKRKHIQINQTHEKASAAYAQNTLPGNPKTPIHHYETFAWSSTKKRFSVSQLMAHLNHDVIDYIDRTADDETAQTGQLHIHPKSPFEPFWIRPPGTRKFDDEIPKPRQRQGYIYLPDNFKEILNNAGYLVSEDTIGYTEKRFILSKNGEEHADIAAQSLPSDRSKFILRLIWVKKEKHAPAILKTLFTSQLPAPEKPKQLE